LRTASKLVQILPYSLKSTAEVLERPKLAEEHHERRRISQTLVGPRAAV